MIAILMTRNFVLVIIKLCMCLINFFTEQAILLWTYLVIWRTLNIQLKTVTLKSNKINDVLIKNIKFGPISISFSHDVYLLFCKRSEKIDGPISRKANNSEISNVLIKKTEFGQFSYRKHI